MGLEKTREDERRREKTRVDEDGERRRVLRASEKQRIGAWGGRHTVGVGKDETTCSCSPASWLDRAKRIARARSPSDCATAPGSTPGRPPGTARVRAWKRFGRVPPVRKGGGGRWKRTAHLVAHLEPFGAPVEKILQGQLNLVLDGRRRAGACPRSRARLRSGRAPTLGRLAAEHAEGVVHACKAVEEAVHAHVCREGVALLDSHPAPPAPPPRPPPIPRKRSLPRACVYTRAPHARTERRLERGRGKASHPP